MYSWCFWRVRFWCIIKHKNIFIESALFNAVSVRKTAKRHGLNTDASFRYERGVDPNMVIPALIRASQLILDLGGGKLAQKYLICIQKNKMIIILK